MTRATSCSVALRGCTTLAFGAYGKHRAPDNAIAGASSACRSSLPLGVSGRRSSTT